MTKFFTPAFWLNQNPGSLIPFWKNLLIAIVICSIAFAIATFIIKKHSGLYKKLLEKLFNFFTTNFFIGIALLFFGQEQIPILSSRFWYILWFAGMIIWAIFIVRYSLTIPERKKEIEKEQEFQKYIPK